MVLPEKCRVKVLRPMAEEIKCCHQQDDEDKKRETVRHGLPHLCGGGLGFPPGGRFLDPHPNKNHEKSGNYPRHKHTAPTHLIGPQGVRDCCKKVSSREARLPHTPNNSA